MVLSAKCRSLLYYAADKTSCNKLRGTRHLTSWLDKQHSYFSGGRFRFPISAVAAASQYFRQFLHETIRILPLLKSIAKFFRLFSTNYKPFVIIHPKVWRNIWTAIDTCYKINIYKICLSQVRIITSEVANVTNSRVTSASSHSENIHLLLLWNSLLRILFSGKFLDIIQCLHN
jgi:hypothetical protein